VADVVTTPAAAVDERRHEAEGDTYWGESWYLDFTDEAGELGGYVRLGLYPNLGVAWYWACVVGEGRPLVTVIDHEVPIPGPDLEVRTEGLWASYVVETPLDHVSVGVEAFAVALDDPADTYRDLRGERTPFGLDLEWETDGGTYAYPFTTRYEIPCRVHGEVLVGDEEIAFDGWGQRDHSWGVRDWWTVDWSWTAGRLGDGTRFHGTHVTLEGDRVADTGYVQPPGGPLTGTESFDRTQQLGAEGLPVTAECRLDDLTLAIEPVAFSPVHLLATDGRTSRFPRALCRYTEQGGAGRRGVGWTEWNQVQPST